MKIIKSVEQAKIISSQFINLIISLFNKKDCSHLKN